MPDRTAYALTPAQKYELTTLNALGAISRDGALSAYDPGMGGATAGVLGILIDKGFVQKRVRTRSKTSRTVYWLTPEGVAQAQQLLKVAEGSAPARSEGECRA